MLAFIEKKQIKKELDETGIYVGEIHNTAGHQRLLICLLRGLMIFLACYGTLVGIVSAFRLPFNHTVVTLFLLFISFYVSFLYYNKIIFYIGYLLLLVVFTRELVRFYLYANSGYQAIINVIYSEYSDYFKLLSVREAQEFYSDRYTTVTVTLLFIGIFLALLLNVTISGYMNLFETILITFPLLEVALYIGKKPPVLCIIMLITSYISIGILQSCGHSRMQVKGMRTHEFLRQKRKKKFFYSYQGSGMGTLLTLVFSTVVATVLTLSSSYIYNAKNEFLSTNSIKQTTDDYIKIFVQTGFTGLLDRYQTTGGLSQGRLGGVSSVRPDFETDLIVNFAPYSYDTVYLKAYTGNYYASNMWFDSAYITTSQDTPSVYMDAQTLKEYDEKYLPLSEATGKMEIENIGADTSFYYLPYNSGKEDVTLPAQFEQNYGTLVNFPLQSKISVAYSPIIGDSYPQNDIVIDEKYLNYVNQCCLEVPSNLKDKLASLCIVANFPGSTSSIQNGLNLSSSPEEYSSSNEYRLAVANAVKQYFIKNFTYTMSPGTTPYNSDFIEYFLFTQKRGYCAHFASSAVLLLRTMGVPARYVEGYCMPLSLLSESQPLVTADYASWYQGPSDIKEQGVLSVAVNDSYAHAWVEIYLDGYGFVPIEVTPPSFEDNAGSESYLSNLLSGFFSIDLPLEEMPSESTNTTDTEGREISFQNVTFSYSKLAGPVLILVGIMLTGLASYFLVKYIVSSIQYKRLFQQKRFDILIYKQYHKLVQKLTQKHLISKSNPLPEDLITPLLKVDSSLDNSTCKAFLSFIEYALYSGQDISEEQYMDYKMQMDLYIKQIYSYKKPRT